MGNIIVNEESELHQLFISCLFRELFISNLLHNQSCQHRIQSASAQENVCLALHVGLVTFNNVILTLILSIFMFKFWTLE